MTTAPYRSRPRERGDPHSAADASLSDLISPERLSVEFMEDKMRRGYGSPRSRGRPQGRLPHRAAHYFTGHTPWLGGSGAQHGALAAFITLRSCSASASSVGRIGSPRSTMRWKVSK